MRLVEKAYNCYSEKMRTKKRYGFICDKKCRLSSICTLFSSLTMNAIDIYRQEFLRLFTSNELGVKSFIVKKDKISEEISKLMKKYHHIQVYFEGSELHADAGLTAGTVLVKVWGEKQTE